MGCRRQLLSACVLWMHFCGVAAMTEPEVCYLLDGILFFYGIILTVLYCHMRMTRSKPSEPLRLEKKAPKVPAEEGVYTGLTPHVQDTYETVGMKKGADM